MGVNLFLRRFKRITGALLACSVALSFGGTVGAFASAVTIEGESCDASESRLTAITDTAARLGTDDYAVWTFNAETKGNYTFSALGNGETPSAYEFYVDGALLSSGALNNTNDWSFEVNRPETELGTVFLSRGEHKLKVKQTAYSTYFLDCLSYTAVEGMIELSNETVLTAEDWSELSENTQETTDGLKINGWADYKVSETGGERAYGLYVNLTDGESIGVILNDVDLGVFSANADEYVKIDGIITRNGENVIRLYSEDEVVLNSIKLKLLQPGYTSGNAEKIEIGAAEFLMEDGKYSDNTPGLDAEWNVPEYAPVEVAVVGENMVVASEAGEFLTYPIDVPEDGKYFVSAVVAAPSDITVRISADGEGITKPIKATGDYGTYIEREIGIIDLVSGAGELRFDMSSGVANIEKLVLTKVDTEVQVYSVFSGDLAVISGRTIPRGTDHFEIYCTTELDTEKTPVITLSDGAGELPVEFEIQGSLVSVYLKDTFDYSSDCVLTINKIYGIYGELSAPVTLGFKTSDEISDTGSSTAEILSGEVENNAIKISGKVNSSKNIGIAGRNVSVSVTVSNDGGVSDIGTFNIGLSETDGAFSYELPLNEQSVSGLYAFVAIPEYGEASEPKNVAYITQSDEDNALLELLGTSAQNIDSWFLSYADYFGLSILNSDGISDESKLNAHFIGADYDTKEELIQDYKKYLLMERMLQGAELVIESVLANEEECETLGIDGEGALLLTGNNKTDFIAELLALDVQTPDLYANKYDEILNKYLFRETGKSVPALSGSPISANLRQSVEIPVLFTEEQDDFSGTTLNAYCENTAAISELVLNLENNALEAQKTVSADGKTASFIITSKRVLNDVIKLGNVSFTVVNTGTYTIRLGGNVSYVVSNNNQTKNTVASLSDVNVIISVSEISGRPASGSSSSTSGGGGSAVKPIIKPVEPDTSFAFSDLQAYSWARESIESLLKAGVISESADKKFYPERNVTREEFVKMLVSVLNLKAENLESVFTDVLPDKWYAPYISAAYENGIITGGTDGSFGVGLEITRQDMAVMAARAMKLSEKADAEIFSDDTEISEYAKDAVYQMKTLGIINGVGENRFEPKAVSNRAMAAKVIFEMKKAVSE